MFVKYRTAQPTDQVGGDWYDARLGADGNAVIAIGDVAGHGLRAAAGMIRIGGTLRGLAVAGLPADSQLCRLNRLVCLDECPERVASVIVGVLDQERPVLRWAQAGHPPPVLVSGGTARFIDRPPGLLLGAAPNAEYGLGQEELAPGDILFLYTDGLIERRGQSLQDGFSALQAAAQGIAGETAMAAAAALCGRLDLPPTDDDTCLIAIRVSG
jgi:serine phosphatase RsbU (regulator of sigma subunit)